MARSASGASGGPVVRSAAETASYLRDRERAENFPVALRVLPRAPRRHLKAVYDVVRTIDDLGDEAEGDRLGALGAFEADLLTLWNGGTAARAVVRALAPAVEACALTPEPFLDLIQANRQDQRQHEYVTREDLVGYCRLSAAPIGALVLAVFGADTPARRAWSDDVCIALQVIEHLQDVGEDHARGRIYLPRDVRERFGVTEADLRAPMAAPGLRAAVLELTTWARHLLGSATPLVGQLRGWAKIAVAGYAGGGYANAHALIRAEGDVLRTDVKAGKLTVLRCTTGVLRGKVPS